MVRVSRLPVGAQYYAQVSSFLPMMGSLFGGATLVGGLTERIRKSGWKLKNRD
ncbi:hypothetical protein ACFVQB_18105 [Paenibacillus sp. NPDC057886]|uniref:hypothetical protein n=1 Tax=Paenibacillus sp. NPDC057886 TaxID=3346270 RepID=UPI0036B7A9CC